MSPSSGCLTTALAEVCPTHTSLVMTTRMPGAVWTAVTLKVADFLPCADAPPTPTSAPRARVATIPNVPIRFTTCPPNAAWFRFLFHPTHRRAPTFRRQNPALVYAHGAAASVPQLQS